MCPQQLMYNQHRPTGPRSMRNGSSQRGGRGTRMLGQLNRSMDRSQNELPDNLRRIRGAAGGQSGRINAHAGREGPPRGPKNFANGVQRAMNGRGGNQNAMTQMMDGVGGQMAQPGQISFMQMMEISAQMMAQAMQQNGVLPPNTNGFQRGGARGSVGSRGSRPQQPHRRELHAVDGKLPDVALSDMKPSSNMDIDGDDGKFSTMCRFNLTCSNPACGFAHQSPAATSVITVDMNEKCSFGAACTNSRCTARHPSPAKRTAHAQEVDCRFFPNCTAGPNCPYRHPTAPPCRNGADCKAANCKFSHSTIECRYTPCLKPDCMFKHAEGQKRGKFEDKVWTANGENEAEAGKGQRFADFVKQGEAQEELIIPGQQNGESAENRSHEQAANSSSSQMDTQITT